MRNWKLVHKKCLCTFLCISLHSLRSLLSQVLYHGRNYLNCRGYCGMDTREWMNVLNVNILFNRKHTHNQCCRRKEWQTATDEKLTPIVLVFSNYMESPLFFTSSQFGHSDASFFPDDTNPPPPHCTYLVVCILHVTYASSDSSLHDLLIAIRNHSVILPELLGWITFPSASCMLFGAFDHKNDSPTFFRHCCLQRAAIAPLLHGNICNNFFLVKPYCEPPKFSSCTPGDWSTLLHPRNIF